MISQSLLEKRNYTVEYVERSLRDGTAYLNYSSVSFVITPPNGMRTHFLKHKFQAQKQPGKRKVVFSSDLVDRAEGQIGSLSFNLVTEENVTDYIMRFVDLLIEKSA